MQQLVFFSCFLFSLARANPHFPLQTLFASGAGVVVVLFPFNGPRLSAQIAYNRAKVRPPLGEYFVSALSKARAALGVRTVPSIRISFAVTLRP